MNRKDPLISFQTLSILRSESVQDPGETPLYSQFRLSGCGNEGRTFKRRTMGHTFSSFTRRQPEPENQDVLWTVCRAGENLVDGVSSYRVEFRSTLLSSYQNGRVECNSLSITRSETLLLLLDVGSLVSLFFQNENPYPLVRLSFPPVLRDSLCIYSFVLELISF